MSNYRLLQILVRCFVFVFILWNNSKYCSNVVNVGFYADDESLKQPYRGDSIHFIFLLASLLGVYPFLAYLINQFERKFTDDVFPKHVFQLMLKYYYTGFLFNLGVIEILKRCFTELRPHFITTCIPEIESKNSDGFVSEFTCTGEGQNTVLGRDLYKSFPSGHAALSVYSFVFLNVYLLKGLSCQSNSKIYTWILGSIALLSFIWTVACCGTRIIDNRHFWWDVLAGIVIGLVAGLISINALFSKIATLPKAN